MKPKKVKVEAGLMKKNHIVSRSGIDRLILSVPFCLYHFFHTILSDTICPYTILCATILSYNPWNKGCNEEKVWRGFNILRWFFIEFSRIFIQF